MRSIRKSSNAAPGVLANQHTPFQATSITPICNRFGIDSEGDSWGIRSRPTDKMMPNSAIVHAVADIGPARRSEFDHDGSGFVRYGARISHTLKTFISATYHGKELVAYL